LNYQYLAVANCSAFEVNHRRLGVHFAVHFLPMPCYCWLGGCGGVQFFCRVLTAPKIPLFMDSNYYHSEKLLNLLKLALSLALSIL
jgi:hypothetical protein